MQRAILIAIITLGFLIRILYLGSIPQGFNPDEASQGYTAYSIVKTGLDEWGQKPSLTGFKSFLDYKAPLQTYLMIPSVAIFGLNEFSTRLPSAIFGTLALFSIYLLANELFPNLKLKLGKYSLSIGLIAAFVLAISPWHIQFSRTALEANLVSFFFPFGLYCFHKGLKKPNWLIMASVSWGLSVYSYHAAKFFVPLFIVVAVFVSWKELIKLPKKSIAFALIVLTLLALPIGFDTVFGNSGKRSTDLLITHVNSDQIKDIALSRYYSPLGKINPLVPRLLHNKLTFVTDKAIENYISYYTPSFWFTEGGREITYSVIPGRGLLFVWQFPFILIGLYWLFRHSNKKTIAYLILGWILLAAIPAALTQEGYRPNRASAFLGLWEMLTAIGFINLLENLPRFKKVISLSLVILVVVSFFFYVEDYAYISLLHFPRTLSYGWRNAVSYISDQSFKYEHIYVERGNESQMMIAFYTKLSPSIHQKAAANWDKQIAKDESIKYLDQLPRYTLDKYVFETFNSDTKYDPSGLYLSYSLSNLPSNRRVLYQVKSPTGDELMEVFDFNPIGKFALNSL